MVERIPAEEEIARFGGFGQGEAFGSRIVVPAENDRPGETGGLAKVARKLGQRGPLHRLAAIDTH